MNNFDLANRIFDCISDGYDDEEEREEVVKRLTDELSECDDSSFIKTSLASLCERIEELEM